MTLSELLNWKFLSGERPVWTTRGTAIIAQGIESWSHSTIPKPDQITLDVWKAEFDAVAGRPERDVDLDGDVKLRAAMDAVWEAIPGTPRLSQEETLDRAKELYRTR